MKSGARDIKRVRKTFNTIGLQIAFHCTQSPGLQVEVAQARKIVTHTTCRSRNHHRRRAECRQSLVVDIFTCRSLFLITRLGSQLLVAISNCCIHERIDFTSSTFCPKMLQTNSHKTQTILITLFFDIRFPFQILHGYSHTRARQATPLIKNDPRGVIGIRRTKVWNPINIPILPHSMRKNKINERRSAGINLRRVSVSIMRARGAPPRI